jgi:hypothetical protein
MPTVPDRDDPGRLRPKYPAAARAILVYRREKVYVLLEDEIARADVEAYSDVRRLSAKEAQELEKKHPFVRFLATDTVDMSRGGPDGVRAVVLLGDVIARLAKIVGIVECEPCRRRRKLLNSIPLWGWWRP